MGEGYIGWWLTKVLWSIISDGDTRCIDGLQLHPVPGISWHAIIVCGVGLIRVELDGASQTEDPLCSSTVRTNISYTAVIYSRNRRKCR